MQSKPKTRNPNTPRKIPKPSGELALIGRIRSEWGAVLPNVPGVTLGIGDDCAILRPPRGHEVLVTTDFSLEGRHFRRDWHPPESAGHRALARGLSDLAAMGAQPLAAFLSLALPPEMLATRAGLKWVESFFQGLRGLADRSAVPLAGGDTSESPCALVLADIVLVGSAPTGRALRRGGANPGDCLYVTGNLGGAAAELKEMDLRSSRANRKPTSQKREARHPVSGVLPHPQLYPEPRLRVGQALLRRRLATAAIDLSDGLSTDLAHLCRESGVGAEIEEALLPIHPLALAAGAAKPALALALDGGEDYELLFTAPRGMQMPRSVAGVAVTRIGQMVRGSAVSLIDPVGRRSPLEPGGWEHFARKH